jgi:peptide-methionine (R)-S-oxide reductase
LNKKDSKGTHANILEMDYNKLSPEEKRIILDKGTEPAFNNEYDNFYEEGTYICRRCNAPLFSSKSKFDAGCGWPAFDESFPNALTRVSDSDGIRTEIECANCGGHLGHEFVGELLTQKNTRECVNSLSIRFVPKGEEIPGAIQSNNKNKA